MTSNMTPDTAPIEHPDITPIRVILADDQELVRAGLAALLNIEPDIDVVAQFPSGNGVADAVVDLGVDVAVLDIEMPHNGITTAAEIAEATRTAQTPTTPERAHAPHSSNGCRVLIVTTFGRAGYLQRAMQAGASGFMVKDAPAEELAAAIRRIHAGGTVIDPTLSAEALSIGANPLTPRERDVLRESLDGAPVREIARRLFLAPGTVRNHASQAIAKTGANNRISAAQAAQRRGWL